MPPDSVSISNYREIVSKIVGARLAIGRGRPEKPIDAFVKR
jgi:hypothetical protein